MPDDEDEYQPHAPGQDRFNLDGQWHLKPGRTACDCNRGEPSRENCGRCGGYLHFQPIYGGLWYCCEDCGYDHWKSPEE